MLHAILLSALALTGTTGEWDPVELEEVAPGVFRGKIDGDFLECAHAAFPSERCCQLSLEALALACWAEISSSISAAGSAL